MQPSSMSTLVAGAGAAAIGGMISDIDSGTSQAHKEADKIMTAAIAVTAVVIFADYKFHVGIYERLMRNSSIARLLTGAMAFIIICTYGSGQPHADTDAATNRIVFAPLMDEFNIDLCLTGHDHSYARTYQILDGKVIETDGVSENASKAYNPEGTLYIAAGSASGSKFYTLNTVKQYYIAERSNTPEPTFSTIDFSGDSLTIKTYDYNGQKYANDVTFIKRW